MLQWRTYRDISKADAPIMQVQPSTYKLVDRADLPNADVFIGEYESARAIRSGERFEAGNTLPASLLRDDIVLLRLVGDAGLEFVIARPQRVPGRSTQLLRPKVVGGRYVNVPTQPVPVSERWKVFDPQPLGDGLFSVPTGFIGPSLVTVDGSVSGITFDYSPINGVFYAENAEGNAVPPDTPIKFTIRVLQTTRKELTKDSEAVIDQRTGKRLATAQIQKRTIEDARRLPVFDETTKWHAVDQAHYDAGPIPQDMFFTIRTNATSENIQEAVRRTLPAGAVYNIEPLPQYMQKLDFSISENSGYLGLLT